MLIRFDFVGGPKDGESVREILDGREFSAAAAYYHATCGGAPGALLWCRTEYLIELTQILSDSALRDLHDQGAPLRGHLYEVFCRSQGDADVHLRARHVGPFPDRIPLRCAAGVTPIQSALPTDASLLFRDSSREQSDHKG